VSGTTKEVSGTIKEVSDTQPMQFFKRFPDKKSHLSAFLYYSLANLFKYNGSGKYYFVKLCHYNG
jgi:hypothetical protein